MTNSVMKPAIIASCVDLRFRGQRPESKIEPKNVDGLDMAVTGHTTFITPIC